MSAKSSVDMLSTAGEAIVDPAAAGKGEAYPAGGLAPITTSTAGALIAALHQTGGVAFEVPKPFSQPICLDPDTRVAGTVHTPGIGALAKRLAVGDRLTFVRDPQNPYDHWAIVVHDGAGNKLGFVPADINQMPARLMNAGKRLYGEVTGVELVNCWWRIGMGVWLDD